MAFDFVDSLFKAEEAIGDTFNKYANIARGTFRGKSVVDKFIKINPQYRGKEDEILALHKKLLHDYHEYFFECKGLETFMEALDNKHFEGKTIEQLEKCANRVLSVSEYTIPGDYFQDTSGWMYVEAKKINKEIEHENKVEEYYDMLHKREESRHVPMEDRLTDKEKQEACEIYLSAKDASTDFYHPYVVYSRPRLEDVKEFSKGVNQERETIVLPEAVVKSSKYREVNMLDMPDYHSVLYVNIAGRNWEFENGAFINVNRDNNGQKVYELTFNPRCVRDFDKDSGSTLDYIEFKKHVKNSLNEQSKDKEIENFKFKMPIQSLQVSKDSEKERSNEGVAGGR